MNLEQLIAQFRVDAKDAVAPYLWAAPELTDWLNEAQAEAAIRGRLIMDDFTPAVCEIAVTAGLASYGLHAKVYEIAHLRFIPSVGRAVELDLVSREKLDRTDPDWRLRGAGTPEAVIQTDTRLRVVPVPSTDGKLVLEAYRTPLKTLVNDQDKPEINEAHHRHLLQWALFRAFSVPDTDGYDPGRAAKAYDAFERYFGPRPDSDLRRATRQDEVHATVAHIL